MVNVQTAAFQRRIRSIVYRQISVIAARLVPIRSALHRTFAVHPAHRSTMVCELKYIPVHIAGSNKLVKKSYTRNIIYAVMQKWQY